MSTWSRMSSARFSKGEESAIGPGSYEIPTTMDDRAVVMTATERFMESVENAANGFSIFEEMDATPKQAESERRKSLRRASSAAKENHRPSSMTPRADREKIFCQESEQEQLKRRLLDEEKRRAQAEARASDLLAAKKAAASAHVQLQSQERKIEQLQKELEDTCLARKEAQRRACDLEADRGRVKKALYDKERELVASQRSLALVKAQLEERGKKLEEIAGDSEKIRQEAALLKTQLQEGRSSTTPAKVRAKASPTRSAPGAEEALQSLHKRFTEQTAQTEGQLQELAKAQERLHECILASASQTSQERGEAEVRLRSQAEELEKRTSQLYFALKQSERQEAQLEATIAIRDASLAATAAFGRRLEEALEAKEGEARQNCEERDQALKKLQDGEEDWRIERLALQKETESLKQDAEHMANKHAEVCGKLFASERAVSLSRAHNEDLLSKLHSSTDQADTRQAEQAAEMERLRAELYEALAGRAEANQALAAKEARLGSLMQEVRDLHICADGLRQKAQEAEKRAEASTARCATLEKEVREVEALRVAAAEAESAKLLSQQQQEDLRKLQKDYEEQSAQNKELLESMQAQQKGMQQLVTELGTLRGAEARFEAKWEKEMAQHTSAGHSNHRQKIQHIIDLKEGNHTLRDELKKARQRIAQLEVACAGEVSSRVVGCRRLSGTAVTTPPRVQHTLPRGIGRVTTQAAAVATAVPATQEDKAYERLCVDYQHLLFLLERAAVCSASSLATSTPNTADKGAAAFLRRLGDMALAERSSRPSLGAPTPIGSTLSKDHPPTTPDKRHSCLDDLSDLGNSSEAGFEAGDGPSDMETEGGNAAK